jgi:DNA-nicking Smr family endonuclease
MPRRRLSAQEDLLWRKVASSVRPIAGRAPALPVGGTLERVARSAGPAAKPSHRETHPSAQQRPGSGTLDASWDRKMGGGRAVPDRTIGLHGETLASGHRRLLHGIDTAVRAGDRVVLIIAGRPASGKARLGGGARGVIRASVEDWLWASSVSGCISAIRPAHPRHGGAGALYVILKSALTIARR